MLHALFDYITGKAAERKRAELARERYKRQVMINYWSAFKERDAAKARGDCIAFGRARKRMLQINVERFRLGL